ncbi:hypothetical protein F183_A40390 [Bryobacterales bacterium F-183]|nr:hypothetical protein F183_A40390 [Bryobacterales bacterium F-183]
MAKNKVSPTTVTGAARLSLFAKPLANKHFEHYLSGAGATVNEDDNIRTWIRNDNNARTVIAKRIREKRRNNESNVRVMFKFEQGMYDDSDAQFSFGAIDRLEAAAVASALQPVHQAPAMPGHRYAGSKAGYELWPRGTGTNEDAWSEGLPDARPGVVSDQFVPGSLS